MATVAYAIDTRRNDTRPWAGRTEIASAYVTTDSAAAAAEIGTRFELAKSSWAVRGYQVRVRVWPEPKGLHATLDFDPDTMPATGEWIHSPSA